MLMLQVFSVLLACVTLVIVQCEATPSPIVLLPGVMGSQLTVMDASRACDTARRYKDLWISVTRLVLHNSCAKKELPLRYDSRTNTFNNNSYVKISVPGFGNTETIEYLDHPFIKYFRNMVEYFVDRGYKRGKSIRGAPYDWRLAPDQLERLGYFHRLKDLVEDTYRRNSNTKVTIVAHSMGGPVSLYFLTGFKRVTQAWKNKFIHAYVPLSAAWSGGAGVLQVAVSGYKGGFPDFLQFLYRKISRFIVPVARTFESIPWLFPKPSVFGNDVLIYTPSKRYTANDYKRLFRDINAPSVYRNYRNVQWINRNYPAPNVPTHCFYGVGVLTPLKFTYYENLTPTRSIGLKARVTNGDGDGSVNTVSSMVCHKWSSMPSRYPFRYKTYNKVTHGGIMSDSNVLEDIGKIVGAPAKKRRWIFG